MEYTWYQFIWLFWIYSFGGWCLEVVNAAVKRKKFVNVGYLNSPFCVIYGFSAVAFAVFLPEIQNSLFFLFLGGVIIAGFIEYTAVSCWNGSLDGNGGIIPIAGSISGAMCAWRQRCFGVFVQ